MRYNSYDLNNVIMSNQYLPFSSNEALQEYLDKVEIDKLKEGKAKSAFHVSYRHIVGQKFRLWKEQESGKIFVATFANMDIQAHEMHMYNIVTRDYEKVARYSVGNIMYQ